ncbi:MAG: class I SAM-dependent methyltransferase [Methanotrichaceae archaeon]
MVWKDRMMEEGSKHCWGFLLIRREELKQLLQRMFEKRGHLEILEIGCYKGMLVGWLLENFPRDRYSWSYVGVDIVEPPDRRKDYPHFVMNGEALEFEANRFDVVIMIETLEHIVDYVKALQEAYRVLKPGGCIFIQSVVCDDPTAISDPTHFHVLHPKTLSNLLRWLGYVDVQYSEGGNFVVTGCKPG